MFCSSRLYVLALLCVICNCAPHQAHAVLLERGGNAPLPELNLDELIDDPSSSDGTMTVDDSELVTTANELENRLESAQHH